MKQSLVAALIFHEGKMLLVHNIKYRLRYEPPGGKIEPGETPEEALRREAEEETGCEIEILSYFGEEDSASSEGEFAVKMYVCKIVSGTPEIPVSERDKIDKIGWYSFEEMQSFKDEGLLAPNLCESLTRIKELQREIKLK